MVFLPLATRIRPRNKAPSRSPPSPLQPSFVAVARIGAPERLLLVSACAEPRACVRVIPRIELRTGNAYLLYAWALTSLLATRVWL
jgi:hypothetical protein